MKTTLILFLPLSLFLCAFSDNSQNFNDDNFNSITLLSDIPVPDPSIYEEDGWYYITGTGDRLTILSSPSLKKADFKPQPITHDIPYQLWNFKIFKHSDNTYHASATINYGYINRNFVLALAHLVPASNSDRWGPGTPITNWKLKTIILGNINDKNRYDYYDPRYMNYNGNLYLIYNARKNGFIGIYIQRMIDLDTIDPAVPEQLILKPEMYNSEYRNPLIHKYYDLKLVESTALYNINGWWVLLYSVGDYDLYCGKSNYKMGVAYSKTFLPDPGMYYKKVILPDETHIWHLWLSTDTGNEVGYVMQSQKMRWHNYTRKYVNGPGMGNIVTYQGRPYCIFHAYKPDAFKKNWRLRYLYRVPLKINLPPVNRVGSNFKPGLDWLSVDLVLP